MFANINGTRIYFDVEGLGSVPEGPIMKQKPVCFILHGGPGGDHTTYKPYLTPLSEPMQLVYIDNRGSGFSEEGPQSTYTLEYNVEDVEALREHLGLDKIILYGHSYGGMTALSYAIKYPEKVEGLIVSSTSASYRFIERSFEILDEKGTEEQKDIANKALNGTFESNDDYNKYKKLRASLHQYSYKTEPSPEEIQSAKDAMNRAKINYQAANEGFREGGFLRNYDITDQLHRISSSTLIITGRHDWITTPQDAIEISENIPDNELKIFEQSSHKILSDEYDLFISTVKEFVERRL